MPELLRFAHRLGAGTLLERLDVGLALSADGQIRVGTEIEWEGRRYVTAPLDSALTRALALPSEVAKPDPSALGEALAEIVGVGGHIARYGNAVLTAVILHTWVADFLPQLPAVNLIGEPGSLAALTPLLLALARHPLALQEINLLELAQLDSELSPTLIMEEPSAPSLRNLQRLCQQRCASYLLRKGRLLDLPPSTVIYTSREPVPGAIHIPVLSWRPPDHDGLAVLERARSLRPQLLGYRLTRFASLARAVGEIINYPPETARVARALLPVLNECATLKHDLLAFLNREAEGERTLRADSPLALLVVALLFCLHSRSQIYVLDVADSLAAIFTRRGETEMSARAVGSMLRGQLGIESDRDGKGYRLRLGKKERSRIHEMASELNVLSPEVCAAACSECAEMACVEPKLAAVPAPASRVQSENDSDVHDVHEVHDLHPVADLVEPSPASDEILQETSDAARAPAELIDSGDER